MSQTPSRAPMFRVRLEDGTDVGTVTKERAIELIRLGVIERGDHIQRVGSERWRRADEVAAFVFEELERATQDPNAASFIGDCPPSSIGSGSGASTVSSAPSGSLPLSAAVVGTTSHPVPKATWHAGWVWRIGVVVAAVAVVWIAIAIVPFIRHSRTRAERDESSIQARLSAEAVDALPMLDGFKADSTKDVNAQLRMAQGIHATRVRDLAGAKAAADAAISRATALERQSARLAAAERESAEARAGIERIDKEIQLAEVQFTVRTKSARTLDEIARLSTTYRDRLANLKIERLGFASRLGDASQVLGEQGAVDAEELDIAGAERSRAERLVEESAVGLASASTLLQRLQDRAAALELLAANESRVAVSGRSLVAGVLWGGFGGLVVVVVLVGGYLLVRYRSVGGAEDDGGRRFRDSPGSSGSSGAS